MKIRTIAAPIALVAAGLFLSACGQASQVAGTAQVAPAAAVVTPPTSPASKPAAPTTLNAPAKPVAKATFAIAKAGKLGTALVGANGNTLYAFTKDVDGVSTCFDACATAWPPVIVTGTVAAPDGISPALVSTVDRPDGSKQLKVGKWPLYYYAGDAKPGEINGQGVGEVWFAEGVDGKLIRGDAAPVPTKVAPPTASPATSKAPAAKAPAPAAAAGPVVSLAQVGNLGEVMVGPDGRTLYAFTDDPAKETTCFDACAKAWPPLLVGEDFTISDDLVASGASTIDRPDGTRQLVMGKWALYYYAGDATAGDANGQGSGDKWFAVNGQCKLVKTAA